MLTVVSSKVYLVEGLVLVRWVRGGHESKNMGLYLIRPSNSSRVWTVRRVWTILSDCVSSLASKVRGSPWVGRNLYCPDIG